MTTKLNLTIEKNTAKKIKDYAEKKNISVSKIAEEYFNSLINEKKEKGKSFVEEFAGIAIQPVGNLRIYKRELSAQQIWKIKYFLI